MYAPLHVHTEHSALDGLARLDKLAAAAKERGITAMAITDHGSLAGIWDWAKVCSKYGIKPIIGMEAYMAIGSRGKKNEIVELDDEGMNDADDSSEGDTRKKRYHHLTVLARNRTGWHNLIRFHNEAQKSVWYKPRGDYELLKECGEGLIVTTGCLASPINSALKQVDLVEDEDQKAELLQQARDEVEQMIDAVGRENVYVEVMYHGIDAEASVIPHLRDLAEEYDLTVVATGDSHYIEADEDEAHEAFLAVGTGATLADEKRFRFNGGGYHLKTYEEMVEGRPFDNSEDDPAPEDEWEQWWVDAVDNTMIIAERIEDDVVPEPQMRLPKFPVEEMEKGNAADELRLRVKRGAQRRYGEDWQHDQELVDRLEHELDVIISMGFADYFLITQDVVEWCRSDNGTVCTEKYPRGKPGKKTPIVVGAGRGSAAGACSSYCLGITGVEPLDPGLLFERFLEPGREGMPDIDIDFPASRRDEVFEYLQYRWGHDKTARIGSATVAKTKAAIKDAARVLKPHDSRTSRAVFELGEEMSAAVPMSGVEPWGFPAIDRARRSKDAAERRVVEEYLSVIENSGLYVTIDVLGEEQEVHAATQIDEWARAFELITKSPGIHPCGFVVSDDPLDELIPLRQQKEGPQIATFDGGTLEDMGFLKMDILGLENLDYLSTAFQIIEKSTGERMTIDDLPYGEEVAVDEEGDVLTDDQGRSIYTEEGIRRAFDLVSEGRTAGLFQLESDGITQLGREVSPDDKNDLSAIIALYRPGPMGADMHTTYARRKNGLEEADYSNLTTDPEEEEWLAEVLGDTYALAIYQEQAMRLGQVIAGFDDKQRSVLRKAIGKKKQDLMDQCYTWWIEGAPQEYTNERGEVISPVFSTETAENVWEFIKAASSYAFNLAHSYAYGHIAFHTAYLKQAYPAEYAAAVLSHAQKDEKRLATLNSLSDEGIEVAAPNVNISETHTNASDGVVYYGLSEVKRVGKVAQSIVDARPEDGFTSLKQLREVTDPGGRRITKTHLSALCDAGALDDIDDRDQLHRKINAVMPFTEEMSHRSTDPEESQPEIGQMVIETKRGKGDDRTITHTPVSYSPIARAGRQLTVLGVMLGDNPLDLLEESHINIISEDIGTRAKAEADELDDEFDFDGNQKKKAPIAAFTGGRISRLSKAPAKVKKPTGVMVLGIVTAKRIITTKKGPKMAVVELADGRRRQEVTIFPATARDRGLENIPDIGELAVVSGQMKRDRDEHKLFATWLWKAVDPLDPRAPELEEVHEASDEAENAVPEQRSSTDGQEPEKDAHREPKSGDGLDSLFLDPMV